jgi:hypothetical protein
MACTQQEVKLPILVPAPPQVKEDHTACNARYEALVLKMQDLKELHQFQMDDLKGRHGALLILRTHRPPSSVAILTLTLTLKVR